MLANRVRKNARHRRKWARRTQVSCYRIYDRDIPELPVAIDWYEGRLYLAEYSGHRADERDEQAIKTWGEAVCQALNISPELLFLKIRSRQRGAEQYVPLARSGERFVVGEGGLRFYVDLTDYLDTGLFLDHRVARGVVREMANGCRVLNLFAYTGSFTVYAAAGGASQTTTVDLSKTYLKWAEDNMSLNGFDSGVHRYEQADVVQWCRDAQRRRETYDLIILDPPTFSNSKRTETVLDIQRDHLDLIKDTMLLLEPGGVLWFSTNARRFRMSEEVTEFAMVVETTDTTVPPDFTRRPHRSWRLEHLP
jgi:23S rRNA G2069 N7-methylase RlmK/C1962 C5-methylase RlmI